MNKGWIAFVLLFVVGTAHAASVSGINKFAWSENAGWINFNPAYGNTVVTGTGMTGRAWSQNFGWINLNPSHGGVLNDGNGTLSGMAWGEQTGWINFSGVTIGNDGVFHGYASGSVLGRISFNCANDNTCDISNFKVQTDWLHSSSSSSSSSIQGQPAGRSSAHGGGGSRAAIKNVSASSSAQPVLQRASPSEAFIVTPLFKMRICNRINKWFTDNRQVLERLNTRLEKHFGFTCK